MSAKTWTVLGALCLVAVTSLPVTASAASSAPSPVPTPGAPTPRPAPPVPPPPPPPPPRNTRPTTWPVLPGDTGPLVIAVQQRLLWLGAPIKATHVMDQPTAAAVAAFRVKFAVGTGTSVTAAVFALMSAVSRARGGLPKECRTAGTVLCVDMTQKSLRVVTRGAVRLTVDARFGSAANPTREGVFHVFAKSRFHISSLYKTPMPFALFFSGGEAVHYSPFFHRDGYNGHSHGCVGLREVKVAAVLFDSIPTGTRVVIYHS
ncbi:MAG TPA: L,D-transpeptidase [Candidatus Nanopelagicales bacterium]